MPEMCDPSILTYESQKDAIFTNGTMEQEAVEFYLSGISGFACRYMKAQY